MNLIQEFLSQIGFCIESIDDTDIEYTTNYDKYIPGNGDDSGHGVIKYYSQNGDLLAYTDVEGQDRDYTEFTSHGVEILKERCRKLVNDTFTKIVNDRIRGYYDS